MMPDLNPVMIWAATYFLHSSLLLGCVWLWFRRSEPASHAFREAVWKLAAIAGLVTASLQLGLHIESPLNAALQTAWNQVQSSSANPSTIARRADVAQPNQAASDQSRLINETVLDHGADEPQIALLDTADYPLPELSIEKQPLSETAVIVQPKPSSRDKKLTAESVPSQMGLWATRIQSGVTAVFAAIGGALLALSLWGFMLLISEQFQFRRRLSRCKPLLTGPAREMLDDLRRQARVRRPVTLMLAEDGLEPGACGWWQWQIVVPGRALSELSAHELRGLLAHELAHLVRGDQWWLLLGRLLAVCFGWQPLNRIALREWQRASEYLCDAWAIQRNVERLSLARCLTTVAEWRLVGLATVAGLGSENKSNLTARVERLVDDRPLNDPWQRHSRKHWLAAAGCLVIAGMVSFAPAATFPTSIPEQAKTVAVSDPAPHGFDVVEADSIVPPTDAVSESPVTRPAIEDHFARLSTLIAKAGDDGSFNPQEISRILNVVRQQVASDMLELKTELDGLERDMGQRSPDQPHLFWNLRLRRFKNHLIQLQQLQNAIQFPPAEGA